MCKRVGMPGRTATKVGTPATHPGPAGIGLGVCLLWGVTVQLSAQGVSALAGSTLFAKPEAGLGAALGAFAGAVVTALLGEALRRGARWGRLLAVALGVALSLVGLAVLPGTIRSLADGNGWPAVPAAILITMGPLLAWRMKSVASRSWYTSAGPGETRHRHGLGWIATVVAISVPFGLLVAFADAR